MKHLIKLSLVIVLVFLQSCDSAKNTTNSERSKVVETKAMNQKLINGGYSSGTISYTNNGDCSYIIVDEKANSKFDPINMDTEKYDAFKNKSMKVYFKYRSLRRANRCNNVRPIEIIDIKKA